MMYSEFIEIIGNSEKHISFAEYSTFIEPIYMECDLSKQEFVSELKDAFERFVYPMVESRIYRLSLAIKDGFVNNEPEKIMDYLERFDFEARKLAYQYLKLYLTV